MSPSTSAEYSYLAAAVYFDLPWCSPRRWRASHRSADRDWYYAGRDLAFDANPRLQRHLSGGESTVDRALDLVVA